MTWRAAVWFRTRDDVIRDGSILELSLSKSLRAAVIGKFCVTTFVIDSGVNKGSLDYLGSSVYTLGATRGNVPEDSNHHHYTQCENFIKKEHGILRQIMRTAYPANATIFDTTKLLPCIDILTVC